MDKSQRYGSIEFLSPTSSSSFQKIITEKLSSPYPAISSPINKRISIRFIVPSWCNCCSYAAPWPGQVLHGNLPRNIWTLWSHVCGHDAQITSNRNHVARSCCIFNTLSSENHIGGNIALLCVQKRPAIGVRKLVKWKRRFSKIVRIEYRRRLYFRGD